MPEVWLVKAYKILSVSQLIDGKASNEKLKHKYIILAMSHHFISCSRY